MPVNFNMSPGNLYIESLNGKISELGYVAYIDFDEISASEEMPNPVVTIDTTHSAEFECELDDAELLRELELYDSMLNTPTQHELCYNVPIMIQRRYHKKPRINKKWLKRYGMKYDEVKIKMNYQFISHNNYDNTFTLEMKLDEFNPILRPDQMIGYRKVEWL